MPKTGEELLKEKEAIKMKKVKTSKKASKKSSNQRTAEDIDQLFVIDDSLPNIISNTDVNENLSPEEMDSNHDSSEEIIIKDEIQVSIARTLRILMNLFSNKHE